MMRAGAAQTHLGLLNRGYGRNAEEINGNTVEIDYWHRTYEKKHECEATFGEIWKKVEGQRPSLPKFSFGSTGNRV